MSDDKNKNIPDNNSNSGADTNYVDACVHNKENREKLYSIIDGLNSIVRKWEGMMDYDIVVCIGAISYRLNNLAGKIDKELKKASSQHNACLGCAISVSLKQYLWLIILMEKQNEH